MSKKKDKFTKKARIIFITKKNIENIAPIFLRRSLVEDELGDDVDRSIRVLLSFKEKVDWAFLGMDKAPFKSLGIYQEKK